MGDWRCPCAMMSARGARLAREEYGFTVRSRRLLKAEQEQRIKKIFSGPARLVREDCAVRKDRRLADMRWGNYSP